MRQARLIHQELVQIGTINDLTGVFEGIASMEIGKIRDKVLTSKKFFHELWNIYSQLRVDRSRLEYESALDPSDRILFVAITSQGGLSGDVDSRVVDRMLAEYDPRTTDVIVIGSHGVQLLAQRGIQPVETFDLPRGNSGFGLTLVEPIVERVGRYAKTIAFHPTYISLSQQEMSRIELIAAVKELGQEDNDGEDEIISEREYEFEPSFDQMVEYLESTMLGLVVSEIILESKLSQPASRFNAMAAAKQRAGEMQAELRLSYNRSKRSAAAERNREILAVLNRKG